MTHVGDVQVAKGSSTLAERRLNGGLSRAVHRLLFGTLGWRLVRHIGNASHLFWYP